MQKKESLEFSFKGTRNYVHGTDIYNKMIDLLKDDLLNKNFDLSFHGIAKNNINLSEIKPDDESLLKFVCKYTNNDLGKKVLFATEDNTTIISRYDYPEDDICRLSELNIERQEVLLNSNSSFSFIENSVALNKYLLETLFPNVNGKWYFTRLQLRNIPTNKFYPLKLLLKANFNFKLTKTEIFISDKSVGYIYFSLV
jgi:hypothetical protein